MKTTLNCKTRRPLTSIAFTCNHARGLLLDWFRQHAVGLTAATLVAAALAPGAWAQTCQDGCFYSNTYQGDDALLNFGSGGQNTAFGIQALENNIDGTDNTAVGAFALTGFAGYSAGIGNTAVGVSALQNNLGSQNTAVGEGTLTNNNSYNYSNTAVGVYALYNNGLNAGSLGIENTASGAYALFSNVSGGHNTATGASALYYNTADNNTANGYHALINNTTGASNLAAGNLALSGNTSGGSNIAIGDSAGINLTTGRNNIDIGNKGAAGESNTIRLGKKGTQTATFVAGIRGTTVAGGIGVLIDSNGRLGTTTSSARFKEKIQPMDKASEAILSLQPVTFRYKHELDPDCIPQFGLVAEQVAKVNPDLVARDDQGKPFTVRYEAVNAMLLNEFIKEHRKAQEQEARIAQLKSSDASHEDIISAQAKEIALLKESVKEQATQIHKASEQLALPPAARRLVTTEPKLTLNRED
jgi:hypothetical protein